MTKKGGRVLAISTDDVETMKKFKAELKAPFAFIPDPQGKLVKLYDSKMPMMNIANRNTFLVGQDGKVVDVKSGSDALDPGGTITACPLHKPKS